MSSDLQIWTVILMIRDTGYLVGSVNIQHVIPPGICMYQTLSLTHAAKFLSPWQAWHHADYVVYKQLMLFQYQVSSQLPTHVYIYHQAAAGNVQHILAYVSHTKTGSTLLTVMEAPTRASIEACWWARRNCHHTPVYSSSAA